MAVIHSRTAVAAPAIEREAQALIPTRFTWNRDLQMLAELPAVACARQERAEAVVRGFDPMPAARSNGL
jgi:hypothetical protein